LRCATELWQGLLTLPLARPKVSKPELKPVGSGAPSRTTTFGPHPSVKRSSKPSARPPCIGGRADRAMSDHPPLQFVVPRQVRSALHPQSNVLMYTKQLVAATRLGALESKPNPLIQQGVQQPITVPFCEPHPAPETSCISPVVMCCPGSSAGTLMINATAQAKIAMPVKMGPDFAETRCLIVSSLRSGYVELGKTPNLQVHPLRWM